MTQQSNKMGTEKTVTRTGRESETRGLGLKTERESLN